jgi:hypothetical protein
VLLLDEIRDGALDDSVSVASLLRKCIVLSARLKYQPMIDWVKHELDGYKTRDSLPDYRRFSGEIVINHVSGYNLVSGQRLTYIEGIAHIREQFESVDIFVGVDQLWSLRDEHDLVHELDSTALALINNAIAQRYTQVTQAYVPVSPSLYTGILSTVRNRVLSFVLQIEDEFPEGDFSKISTSKSTRDLAAQVFNTTIINRGTVTVGSDTVNVNQVEKQIVIGDIDSLHAFLESEGFDPQDFPALDEALSGADALEQAKEGTGPVAKWSAEAAKKVAKGAGNVVTQTVTQVAIKAALAYAGLE